ncbi:MAG: DUF3576 domain-containing protein [Pseudomonadota bacterium]
MALSSHARTIFCLVLSLTSFGLLSACGPSDPQEFTPGDESFRDNRSSFFALFENRDDPNVTLEVNKYLWTASIDVLGFMPVQSADPFSGLLVFGYGTPPGGSRSYRATVLIDDPALDARSLNLSLQTRSGPADADTVRAVEDAILTRARQLRIDDNRL